MYQYKYMSIKSVIFGLAFLIVFGKETNWSDTSLPS